MGAPGRDDDDDGHLVRVGTAAADGLDEVEEDEEEDPEEEEFEDDPEEVVEEEEEVGVDEEPEDPEEEDAGEEVGQVAVDEEPEELEDEEEEEVVVEVAEEEGDELEEEEVEEEEEEEEGYELEEEEEVELDEEADELEEVEEEGEIAAENNEEEAKESEDGMEEGDKPSTPPIPAEEDAIASDRLSGGKHIEIKTNTDTHGNETDDSEDIKPRIFIETEPLKNENVDCAYKGEEVNVPESDCGINETSQLVNEKDAKDIEVCDLRGDSKGFEAAETRGINPSISIESGAVKYDKVDCGCEGYIAKGMQSDGDGESCQHTNNKISEDTDVCAHHSEPRGFEVAKFLSCNPPISMEAGSIRIEEENLASKGEGVKRMESDFEEKETTHINKKVVESIDVYAPSSESKSTAEIFKPHSIMGLDSESVLMQEGGVEDMDLDSEENVVHGSDVDGTVVDSIQDNTALNSHIELSFNNGSDTLNNKTVVTGSRVSSCPGGKESMHNHMLRLGESTNMNSDPKEHITPKSSRMAASVGKERSLPPAIQLMDRNKRPAIICNYYAKGWCIKGNSCSFLHVKENNGNTSKPQEKNLASANGENHVCEGVGDSTKIIFPEQHTESHVRQLNNKLGHSYESRLLHSAKHESGCSVVTSSSAFAGRLRPSNVNATLMFNDPLESIANRYINQHLHPFAATDVYSSRYIPPINGSSNSMISLKPNLYDAHKILSGSIGFNGSSSSLGLGAQPDRLNSHGLVPKAELYKWEPSKPFRPLYSFSIPSVSSPGSLYDPLRDSIEHSSLGIESFKAERIHYPSHQSYPDSVGNHFNMNGDNGTMPDRYGHSRVTGVRVIETEAEAAESSVADQGYLGSAPGGDKGSGTSNGKDLFETNKTKTVSTEKKRKLTSEKINSNGVDVDRRSAEDDQRESKTFRQFRVALIEFIKELLKPTWRVGNLSKEAHNLIVKKAMKKVLNSIHSYQVPSTPESVQQYLSASQPKITKLLEAYVQKHNKK